MANLIPKEKANKIRELVYSKADARGLISCGRNENGKFMTSLVEDPEVGGVLSEYLDKSNIRTYIKDAIINGYTKNRKKEIIKRNSPEEIIQKVYSVSVERIQSVHDVTVCRSKSGKLFIVSSGTFLKWESALRKALELIARESRYIVNGKIPEICLQIAVTNLGVTDGDKKLVTDSLKAIGVKASFINS
jgi:hypothetical protein